MELTHTDWDNTTWQHFTRKKGRKDTLLMEKRSVKGKLLWAEVEESQRGGTELWLGSHSKDRSKGLSWQPEEHTSTAKTTLSSKDDNLTFQRPGRNTPLTFHSKEINSSKTIFSIEVKLTPGRNHPPTFPHQRPQRTCLHSNKITSVIRKKYWDCS